MSRDLFYDAAIYYAFGVEELCKAFVHDVNPPDDPHGWWRGTSVMSLEEFIAMAKYAAPGTAVQILRRGETYTLEVPESRR